MLSRVQYFLNRTTNWDCGPNSIERSVPETFFYSSSVFTSVHGRYHEHKNRFLERTCPTSRSHTTLVPRKTALRTKLMVLEYAGIIRVDYSCKGFRIRSATVGSKVHRAARYDGIDRGQLAQRGAPRSISMED